ncbi:MAG: type VI secretion system tip protein TssI/VgrG [Polyangiaceae bacterium]
MVSTVGLPSSLFELEVGSLPAGALVVVSVSGREAMSDLPSFEVEFHTELEWSELAALVVLQPAALSMHFRSAPPRWVQGIAVELEVLGPRRVERLPCRLRLVPRMWLLRRKRGSRIFQDRTVVEVIDAVLDEGAVRRRWSLASTPPRRAYCLQYEETDYAFVRRLCAEDGIFFFFEHGPAGETVVFGDGPAAYLAVGGDASADASTGDAGGLVEAIEGAAEAAAATVESALGVDAPGAASSPAAISRARAPDVLYVERSWALHGSVETVHALSFRHAIRPNAAELRDYEFRTPLLKLVGKATAHPTPDAPPTVGLSAPPLAVYDHRGDYEEQDAANAMAAVHLEQHRTGALRSRGASTCRHFAPGHRFRLFDHPEETLNREYVVTAVRHRGRESKDPAAKQRDALLYENRFRCVPVNVAYRPPRPAPRLRQVLESAMVTGPAGSEIHPDEFGRIKVQFHWDRDGKHDEHSSCWLRVVQQWAGAAYGAQFIPRVGTEVLVSFVGGDPDRPVVVGSVYNTTHPVPFALPAEKTRSGWRTRSSLGGGGFNELSFDDAAGGEQILVRAERNLVEDIQHDHTATVKHNQTVTVLLDRLDTVGVSRREVVGGLYDLLVGGDAKAVVEGNASRTVHRDAHDVVERDASTSVGGSQSIVVGTNPDTDRAMLYVTGSYDVGADHRIAVKAQKSIALECGDSVLEITPDGIKLTGKNLELAASSVVKLQSKGDGPALKLDEHAELASKKITVLAEKATLTMDDKQLSARAPVLDLSVIPDSLVQKKDDPDDPKTKKVSLKLTDPGLAPYANKQFHLVVGDDRFEGTTDGEGVVHASVPIDATQAELTLWIDDYPQGRRRHWRLTLQAKLPPMTDLAGVQRRLKNLGYYEGEVDGKQSDSLRSGVQWFQKDAALPPTGEIDDATRGKLDEAHGG